MRLTGRMRREARTNNGFRSSLPNDKIRGMMAQDEGEAVSDTKRKRGEAYANNATYWHLYGDNRSKKTQKPPPAKVSGFNF